MDSPKRNTETKNQQLTHGTVDIQTGAIAAMMFGYDKLDERDKKKDGMDGKDLDQRFYSMAYSAIYRTYDQN